MNCLTIEKDTELFGFPCKGVYRYYFQSKDGLTFGMGLGFDRILSEKELYELTVNPYKMFEPCSLSPY